MGGVEEFETGEDTVSEMTPGQSGYVPREAICVDRSRQGWVYGFSQVMKRAGKPFRVRVERTDRGVIVRMPEGDRFDSASFDPCEDSSEERLSIQNADWAS